jgi:hypothetical protein
LNDTKARQRAVDEANAQLQQEQQREHDAQMKLVVSRSSQYALDIRPCLPCNIELNADFQSFFENNVKGKSTFSWAFIPWLRELFLATPYDRETRDSLFVLGTLWPTSSITSTEGVSLSLEQVITSSVIIIPVQCMT